MADINYPIANKQELDNLKQEVGVSLKTSRYDIDTLERSDIRLAGQINNLVETTKPLVPDVKVSTYKPVTTLSPNAQEGQMNVKVSGLTLKNKVKNGDFRDGTTGWFPVRVSLSASNNILSAINDTIMSSTWAHTKSAVGKIEVGDKVYTHVGMRVTNSEASLITSVLNVSSGSDVAPPIDVPNPVINTWYKISGVSTAIKGDANCILSVRHFYPSIETAQSKVMEIKDAMVINLTETFGAGNEPTKEQMDEMVNNYFEGLTSVQTGTVKTTGKNLFDKSKMTNDRRVNHLTGILIVDDRSFASDFIPVFPKETIFVPFDANEQSHAYYGKNREYLSGDYVQGVSNIVIPDGAYYYRRSFRKLNNNPETLQIERGATSTPYEPYQETTYSLPDVKLHSLPNGVRDYIEGNKLVKNVGEYVLKDSDIFNYATTTTNMDVVYIGNSTISDIINFGVSDKLATKLITSVSQPNNNAVWDTTAQHWRHSFDPSQWFICVPKETYVSLADAKVKLAGIKILYQLAQPIITELPPMTLKSNPKGSVIYLPSRKVISSYTTKAETTVPIKTITKITKVLTDGTRIPISVNVGLTAAPDKLSFTHTSLTNGDNIEWEYDFDATISTSPLIEYRYENSKGEFPCRNLVVNGDFSKGATGWIVESGITIIDGKMIFTNTVPASKAEQTIIKLGDVYYSSFEISDYISGKLRIEHGVTSYSDFFSGNGKKSFLSKSLGNTSFNVRAMESSTNLKVDNVIVINLTETFGAGNEPTKEQMDKIMELHGGWFDGTVNPLISAKDMYKLLVKDVDTGWLNLTPLNGWSLGADGFLQVRKTRVGVVEFRANNLIAGTVTSYTNICSIPSSFIAFGTVAIIAINGQNGNQVFLYYAGANGSLTLAPNSGITTGMRLGFYAMWRTE